MALIPVRNGTIEDKTVFINTVHLLPADAIHTQKKLVSEWQPWHEVWPLKYGRYIAGATSAASAVFINTLFKRKLKLRFVGEYVVTISSVLVPGLMATCLYDENITNNILVYRKQCSICYELKAATLINFSAIALPLLGAPALNLSIASGMGLTVPYAYEIPEIARFWWRVVKPALGHLAILMIFNAAVAGFIVHQQFSSRETMSNILLQYHAFKDEEARNQTSII